MVIVAFYKARGTWRDAVVRSLTGSIYSHCELVGRRVDGTVWETIAASKRDGNQVRLAQLDLASGHWDVLTYAGEPGAAWERATAVLGQPYDIGGAVLSGTALARPRDGRWFCSELIAMAIGMREPHEFSPGMLASAAVGEVQMRQGARQCG